MYIDSVQDSSCLLLKEYNFYKKIMTLNLKNTEIGMICNFENLLQSRQVCSVIVLKLFIVNFFGTLEA